MKSSIQNNLELMRTLDDAWNAQDWETFEKRHSQDTVVSWPGQPEPTRGRQNHKVESIEFFKTFPDNHRINHPYKIERLKETGRARLPILPARCADR